MGYKRIRKAISFADIALSKSRERYAQVSRWVNKSIEKPILGS